MAHAHQKNYTNKYSLHSSHLIPPPLNQSSRVTGTINLDANSYIISNNSILLGKVVIVKETIHHFFFSNFIFHYCILLLFIKLTHHQGIACSSFISF